MAVLLLMFVMLFTACAATDEAMQSTNNQENTITRTMSSDSEEDTDVSDAGSEEADSVSIPSVFDEDGNLPQYDGEPYIIIHQGQPEFTKEEKANTSYFESYSDLDSLGRCGAAFANICEESMPTEERGEIGMIKPSGWHTVKYENLIDDLYLYNRCHLIGYQLAGENANEKNLITGTRYLNVEGMLPFEDEVADYVTDTKNHVLYRVTPVFEGDNLVASGVVMEGWSVEDSGEEICFHVYCFNVQSNIVIDYATGDSYAMEGTEGNTPDRNASDADYIINTNTDKFHLPACSSVNDMNEKNKKPFTGTIAELIHEGYSPCQRCLGDIEP